MIFLIVILSLAIIFDTIDFFCIDAKELTIIGVLGSFGRGILIALGIMVVILCIEM